MLKIHDDDGGFYVFEDVAELFWPGDEPGYDNHEAADRIRAELLKRGCQQVSAVRGVVRIRGYATPFGVVSFDPEADCCEFQSTARPAVEYVCDVIRGMLAERAGHREALR
jgi:hypothetical protein